MTEALLRNDDPLLVARISGLHPPGHTRTPLMGAHHPNPQRRGDHRPMFLTGLHIMARHHMAHHLATSTGGMPTAVTEEPRMLREDILNIKEETNSNVIDDDPKPGSRRINQDHCFVMVHNERLSCVGHRTPIRSVGIGQTHQV